MSEWKTYKLGEIYDFSSGLSKGKEYFGKGFEFVTFKDVFQNYFLPHKLTALVESNEKERQKCSVNKGDVFLTRTSENDSELGLSSVALKNYPNATFNGFTKRLRPNGKVDIVPEYVGYYFRSPKFRNMLSQFATMTTRASLNNEILSNLTIDLPKEQIQFQIGSILKSLDDKIELLQQMNQTLENIAQAIFKEWFVDFNFPGFDGELVDGLPKGWRQFNLADLVETVSKTFKFPNGDGVFLNTSDILEGEFLHTNYTNKENLPGQAKKSIQKGDILFSEIRPANKRYAYVDFDASNYVVSTKLMVLRSKGIVDNLLVYFFMKSEKVINQLQMLAETRSGTFPQITYFELSKIEINIPTDDILKTFTRFLESSFKKIRENQYQIQTLTQTRDTLLPKLMSGKIRLNYD